MSIADRRPIGARVMARYYIPRRFLFRDRRRGASVSLGRDRSYAATTTRPTTDRLLLITYYCLTDSLTTGAYPLGERRLYAQQPLIQGQLPAVIHLLGDPMVKPGQLRALPSIEPLD